MFMEHYLICKAKTMFMGHCLKCKAKTMCMIHCLKKYYAHLNTFVQSYDIASEALNNFKKIHYMY